MCGIAGILEGPGALVDRGLLDRMTDTLAHRGPDGRGTVVVGPAGLGHRRLSIIDLSTGAQPMASVDGTVWVIFNGEIYNYLTLRADLQARGQRFETASDTEVIIAAYREFGIDCLQHLRGMFAFALWDVRQQQLLVARDRLGIKPVVYTYQRGRLLFASEIKALLEDHAVRRELDWESLRDYLTLLYVPSPRTIFQDICKLEPGTYLLARSGEAPVVHRYWSAEFQPDPAPSLGQWTERLSALLDETVRLHLQSDVPLGAFLSGGMDSSTVVAHMVRTSDRPVRTFAIGFDEADFDEIRYARLTARHLGTDHYEMVVKPDALDVLPRLAWQFDEPFGDASAVPTYYVSRIAREHVTVALSGDGGDELFAGYTRYRRALRLRRLMDRPPAAALRPLLRGAASLLPRTLRGRGALALLGSRPLDRYLRMMTYQHDGGVAALLSPEAQNVMGALPGPDYLTARADGIRAPDYLSTLQALDIGTYLPEDILTKVDRASMLVALETRVPLLDHVLVEFLARVPSDLKLRDGDSKYLLKRAMGPLLPPEILTRPKMGFAVPVGRWFRGPLAEYLRGHLLGRRFQERGLFDAACVRRLIDRHQTGRRDHSSQLWSLLVFEQWARQWLDR